uniref:Helitron helicase-like domain-containing protein n=1 Tax=Rhizophagus irregularis (strain DAOM 181602 / DAOM 197198 / MUCL 43194) TaxID=747089 RepID=U9TU85_RHIID
MNEQHETRLSYYRERRNYLKNIQNTTDQDLNSQRQQPQQKSQDSGADGADGAEIRVAADALKLRDDQQDYIDLINKLQRHTQCNPSYCLRINRESKQVCRFGYPKEIVERTFVRDDSRGQLELVTARNDQYINPHSRLQLQGW